MSTKKNNFVFWMIALVAVGLLTMIMVKLAIAPKDNNNGNATIAPVTTEDRIKGNPDSTITLLEYSDFQCPACAQYYTLLKQVEENFGDKIKFVYRHFPLKTIHPNAQAAALAAEAANQQGKFWEMHDQLFINQQTWSPLTNPQEAFVGYAQTIGLDTEKFIADMKIDVVKDKVDRDLSDAYKNKLKGTPTFFLNGKQIAIRNYDDIAGQINALLNQ